MSIVLNIQQKNYIQRIIMDELLKRSINVTINNLELKTARNHELYVDFTSTPFNTMPVLFKSIHIHAFNSSVMKQENHIRVYISVNARYTVFDGGTNGIHLVSFNFELYDSGFNQYSQS